ncbi:MAG: hypothetical protein WED05_06275 [Candidatus Atabeyarchaeum deiterrae]
MNKLSKIVGASILTLMILSLGTCYTSAATTQYQLAADRGTYVDYKCLFSNSTESYINNRTTLGLMLWDKNMSYGTAMPYPYNDTTLEGAYVGLYLNETLEDAGEVNIETGPPFGLVFFPASDAWWNFMETFLADPSLNVTGLNRITIYPSEVNVTIFMLGSGYNGTIWLTVDRYTGVTSKLSVLSVEIANATNRQYYQYEMLQYSVPNIPQNPQPLPSPPSSALFLGVAAVGGLTVSLVAGYFIGSKTGRGSKK